MSWHQWPKIISINFLKNWNFVRLCLFFYFCGCDDLLIENKPKYQVLKFFATCLYFIKGQVLSSECFISWPLVKLVKFPWHIFLSTNFESHLLALSERFNQYFWSSEINYKLFPYLSNFCQLYLPFYISCFGWFV